VQRSLSELVAFEIDRDRFGIVLGDVKEIVRAVTITKLPKAPAVIEGVINARGSIIPVLDIRARFRLPPKPVEPSDQLVIARAAARIVAIRVDRVIGLITVTEEEIADIDAITPTSLYVAGVARLPEGLFLIHDLGTFLSEAEAHAMDLFEEQLAS